MFLERAQRLDWHFSPPEEAPWVVRVCQLVEGMPLGIELAAAWVGQMPCQAIAEAIERNVDVLATTMRDVPARHRSLRAVFDHSWDLLSEEEQWVFRQLSVFRGGFQREAAGRVAGATRLALESLEAKSLLRRTASGRYELHELLRQYAAEKLQTIPRETQRVRELHGRYYASFLHQCEAHLIGQRQQETLDEIGEEIDNVRLAWRWAIEQGKIDSIAQSLETLDRFYEWRSWFQEGERAFTQAAQGISKFEIRNSKFEIVLAKLLRRQAGFRIRLERRPEAKPLLRRSLAIARRLDACDEVAGSLNKLGNIAEGVGNYARAKRLYQASLAVFKDIGDRWGMSQPLNNLAETAVKQGAYLEARRLLQEYLTVCQELGHQWGVALAFNNQGVVAIELGEYTEAQQLLEKSLAMRREMDDRKGTAYSLKYLGKVAEAVGAYTTAEQRYRESLALFKEIGDPQGESYNLSNLGRLYHHLSDDEAACLYSQQAARILRDLGNRLFQGEALTHLGHALTGLGRLAEAGDAYQQAVVLRREVGRGDLAMEAVAGLARVSLAQGDPPQALVHVEEILNHLENNSLEGTAEPFLVYLTCYRVLQAGQDPRAPAVLETAHTLLQERAAKIQDEAQRRSFLENVAAHREIVNEWLKSESLSH